MTAERYEKQVGKPTADKTELANMPSGSESQRRKAGGAKLKTPNRRTKESRTKERRMKERRMKARRMKASMKHKAN